MENAAPIAVSLGVMNIFVGVLNLTGFTQVFASSLVELSGGVLALLLRCAMVAALLSVSGCRPSRPTSRPCC